jgi:hypothetical protein
MRFREIARHGSWLDMAESELGALTKQCLDRRIPDEKTIIKEIAAWERERNRSQTNSNVSTLHFD